MLSIITVININFTLASTHAICESKEGKTDTQNYLVSCLDMNAIEMCLFVEFREI